jgi:hypothetical protein
VFLVTVILVGVSPLFVNVSLILPTGMPDASIGVPHSLKATVVTPPAVTITVTPVANVWVGELLPGRFDVDVMLFFTRVYDVEFGNSPHPKGAVSTVSFIAFICA